jgi:hypothetical protein
MASLAKSGLVIEDVCEWGERERKEEAARKRRTYEACTAFI